MSGLEARSTIEAELRRELFGPLDNEQPTGSPIDCSKGTIALAMDKGNTGPFHDAATKQEILTVTPLQRYGIGVLHGRKASHPDAKMHHVDIVPVPGLASSVDNPECPPVTMDRKWGGYFDDLGVHDFDLTDMNSFKPSAMAISFQCRANDGGYLKIRATGAYYEPVAVAIPNTHNLHKWWCRRPFTLKGTISADLIKDSVDQLIEIPTEDENSNPKNKPTVRVFSRLVKNAKDPNLRLLTVALVNEIEGNASEAAFFQTGFKVINAGMTIEPYPEAGVSRGDDEDKSIELLYRDKLTYAIGHGCAADWQKGKRGEVTLLHAVALPAYETVSLTPNIFLTDKRGEYLLDNEGRRQTVLVEMRELADGTDKGTRQICEVLRLYDAWISDRTSEINDLHPRFRSAAKRHMELASEALRRMREGWKMVKVDPVARQAFRWANHAILYQQVRSNFPLRQVILGSDGTFKPKEAYPTPDVPEGRGAWRPFQIAFILATLPELVDPSLKQRSLVDLLYFPTGGGKTEAYLGACAVSLLARRLRDPDDTGTDVLIRYTLRLLTAQQFLRAASLICVLESIRRDNSTELGTEPFSIGVWLGGASTPNSWKQATSMLNRLENNLNEQNYFLLSRCPWCGTQMGPIAGGSKRRGKVAGYQRSRGKVVLRCVDRECPYNSKRGLPVHVVDEDIYTVRPSIVIGTVDKFAMLAWKPEARSLFGYDSKGKRTCSPPGLILQDELHLISGPLGSIFGLYEPAIAELCTDRRHEKPIIPKIIASTATARRYEKQINELFGREEVAVFPPFGLKEGHSFFAEPAREPDGQPVPGRRYIGVMSASFGSMQTVQTRVIATMLQSITKVPEIDRDGYWTNLNFLNSLRELGNTISLIESDVPDYLAGLRRRDGVNPRWPRHTMELTSRRRSDEIPQAIEKLQVGYDVNFSRQEAVDVCLASSIIEAGIDIDRLSLMTIVGQPKTTAQYIQVSGRVGRCANVNPGLVVTLYGASKPRDRSHYERFRTYHQQLYAQVEPMSVTPFATSALKRALHSALLAYMRQVLPLEALPYPFPANEFDRAVEVLRERVSAFDKDELLNFDRMVLKRREEWRKWEKRSGMQMPQINVVFGG